MRSIPGMTVICPADDVEARAAVRAAYAMEGPVYLRFGRLAVPVFHDADNYHFEIGKGEQITEGNDIAIIATGLMVNEARIAAEQLAADLTNPFGPALAAALAALPDWGPTPIATEQQAKTS